MFTLTLPRVVKICVSQLAATSLFVVGFPRAGASVTPSVYGTGSPRGFQLCAAELLRVGIAPEVVSATCTQTIRPENLSECVLRINALGDGITDDALFACSRVRRSLDLATCVVDINQNTPDPQLPTVINYCRSSLLPVRFSQCVIGFSRATELPKTDILNACIDAEDFPR